MLVLEVFMVCFLGLVLGSFATAMIYRIPRRIPWAFNFKKQTGSEIKACRSACPHCGAQLQVCDLIPLLSWLSSKGRCRHCAAGIGVLYPATELLVFLACLLIYAQYGLSAQGWVLMALAPFLVALLMIDLQHMILPNQLVLIVGAGGLLHFGAKAFVFETLSVEAFWLNNILGAAVFAGMIWALGWFMGHVLKKEALGFGDVKFFAVAGLWLGLNQLPVFCMLSGGLGVLLALSWRALKKEKVFPFGPALILSFFVLLLFDGSLLP